jgi:hypothetical protein
MFPNRAWMKAASSVASISIIRGTIGKHGRWPTDWTATLAGLARLTIREAYQHQWSDRLKSLCGWRDDGGRMLRLALRSPEKARQRWNRLLETDGLRGEYDPKTGQWNSFV